MNPDSQIQQAMRLQSQNSDNDKKLLEDFNTFWVTFSKESREKFHLTHYFSFHSYEHDYCYLSLLLLFR